MSIDLTPSVTLEQQTYNLGKAYWIAAHVLDDESDLLNTGPCAKKRKPSLIPAEHPKKTFDIIYNAATFRRLLDEETIKDVEALIKTVSEDYPDPLPPLLRNYWTKGYYAASRHKPLTLACRRKDLGYTLEQMACLLRCRPEDLRMVENGEARPTELLLDRLASKYQFPPNEISEHTHKSVLRHMREKRL